MPKYTFLKVSMENNTKPNWWKRTICIIKVVIPFNILSFIATVIGGGIRYGIDKGVAETPGYYNITQDHARAIKKCLEESMPAASIYEAIKILFSEDWWHWEIFTYMCCVSTTLLVCDLVGDAYQRYQNALKTLTEHVRKQLCTPFKYMPSREIDKINQQIEDEVAQKKFVTKVFWCGFFKNSDEHSKKINFPYKWIINPSFVISLLYFYYSCKSHVAKFIEDIPVEYHKLINNPDFNYTDHACLDVMARARAGESVFNLSANMEIFLPMLILASFVIGRDVVKFIWFFGRKMQERNEEYSRLSDDDSDYHYQRGGGNEFWKGFRKVYGGNESVSGFSETGTTRSEFTH
jgi:hypothetical protein